MKEVTKTKLILCQKKVVYLYLTRKRIFLINYTTMIVFLGRAKTKQWTMHIKTIFVIKL